MQAFVEVGCLAHKAYQPQEWQLCRRDLPERDDDGYRDDMDPFTLDAAKLFGDKTLARLTDRLQVLRGLSNPYTRTRMRHTFDVAGTAIMAEANLGLNNLLVQAIALGHDIGHLPFGHLGEAVISKIYGKRISHATFGAIAAQEVSRRGRGLNLTDAVLSGIALHSSVQCPDSIRAKMVQTQEAELVRLADKIAYVFADFNDLLRSDLIERPGHDEIIALAEWFGENQRQRVAKCLLAIATASASAGKVEFSGETAQKFNQLKNLLYEQFYNQFDAMRQDLAASLRRIHDVFSKAPWLSEHDPTLLLCLLTDKEAEALASITHDTARLRPEHLTGLGIAEIYPHLAGKHPDLTNPGLDWIRV